MVSEQGHSTGTGNIYRETSGTPWWVKKIKEDYSHPEYHVHLCACVSEGRWKRQEGDMNSHLICLGDEGF